MVRRYHVDEDGYELYFDDGPHVSYEDYAVLSSELSALRSQLAMIAVDRSAGREP